MAADKLLDRLDGIQGRESLSAERLRQLLAYDAESGAFRWRLNRKGGPRAGAIAAGMSSTGYLRIGVDGNRYKAHRLAWLYMTGAWPVGEIDHINGARRDNRWSNLRDVPREVNNQNRRVSLRPKIGGAPLGVHWHSQQCKWRACVSVANRQIHLGLFETQRAASEAYIAAKRMLHQGCTL